MIRPASLEDELNLRALLTEIDENDYVLDHLSTWLQEKSIIVFERESILGMVRSSYSKDGKAHLGSVRVHPGSRRQGIATALTEHCINECGTDVVRLAIMDNKVSEIVAQKIGFEPVAYFTFLLKKTPFSFFPVPVIHGRPSEALSHLGNSVLFEQSHSLISCCFKFYTPSEESLKNTSIFFHESNLVILDFEIEEALTRAIQIAYCDPDPELIKYVNRIAFEREIKEIWAVVPKNEKSVTCLENDGFQKVEWGETITVLELVL